MIEIPPVFLDRMQHLLGDEFPAFLETYTQPPVNGLRVNTLKITPQALQKRVPFSLEPVAGVPAGFRLPEEHQTDTFHVGIPFTPGKNPYHAAGLYYLQEPSAMCVAEILAPQPGEIILDLCAAPGGKSTHLAALMQNEGLLIANEIHPRRVWELAENLERCGVRNAVVTNASPERLAQKIGPVFDRVLVDAPCSGEGMFRKSKAARQDWSPDLVQRCMLRQHAILDQAAKLVRPGGWLVYSTCTFNPQENEQVIATLLAVNPHFELVESRTIPGSQNGHPDWLPGGATNPELVKATRLWPHSWPGEGHFITLLHQPGPGAGSKKEENNTSIQDWTAWRTRKKQPGLPKAVIQAWKLFLSSSLQGQNLEQLDDPQALSLVGSYLYLIANYLPNLKGMPVIHPGLWLGSLTKGDKDYQVRFEPSHALAMALDGESPTPLLKPAEDQWGIRCQNMLHLALDEPDLVKYLRGEILTLSGEREVLTPGWVLVTVAGFPIGWGKFTQGRLKNYYPRGLRWV